MFSCRKDKKASADNYINFEKIDSSDVSQFKIKVSTSITYSNLFTIKSKGFCWSKFHMPSIKDSVVYITGTSNSFSFLVQNLNVNTKYYFRSFATNEMGIYYSDEYEYKTLDYQPVTLSTISPFNIFRDTANVGGEIIYNGGSFITEKGICWSTLIFPTKTSIPSPNFIICGTGDSIFKATIKNLTAGQIYHVRAYAINVKGISYGNDQVFQTLQPDIPEVVAYPISNISKFSANSGSIIMSNSGSPITETGIVWGTSPMPDIFSIYKNISFSPNTSNPLSLTNLNPNTQYYVRAYAKNNVGIAYSNQLVFMTLPPTLPIVNTLTNKTITSSNAILNINVSSDGGALLQSKGIVLSNNSNVDLTNYILISSYSFPDTGNFTFQFSNLNPGSLYYYKSFATNSVGTSYGSVQSFTTLTTLPSLTLSNANNITQSGAIFNISNINDGGSNITSRGIVWDVYSNPTISLSTKIINGSTGNSNFSEIINVLNYNSTYYVRAFATNSLGTSYSNQIVLTTLPSPPILDMSPQSFVISCITSNSVASLYQPILSNGGSSIISKGFYCSTNPLPNASNNIGYFNLFSSSSSSDINGSINQLTNNTNYYIRAFAINNYGTTYGPIRTFSTLPSPLGAPLLQSPMNNQTFSLSNLYSNTNGYYMNFQCGPPTVNGFPYPNTQLSCGSDTVELFISKGLFASDTILNNTSLLSQTKNNLIKFPNCNTYLNPGLISFGPINMTNALGTWNYKVRLRSGGVIGPWSTLFYFSITP